jgi:hypothetical protein
MKRVVNYNLEAATDHTFSYLGKYLLIELLPVGWWTCLLWSWSGPATAIVGIGIHVISLAVLFPGALLMSRLSMRVARRRTWDLQPWRGWVAAVLAVAIEWTYLLNSNLERDAPQFLQDAVGAFGATLIHFAGVLVLASTAAQITAWLLPPSSRR